MQSKITAALIFLGLLIAWLQFHGAGGEKLPKKEKKKVSLLTITPYRIILFLFMLPVGFSVIPKITTITLLILILAKFALNVN